MKKLALTLVTFVAITSMASAQGGYLRIGLGYGFPHAGTTADLYGEPYSGSIAFANNGTTYASYNIQKASLSAGLYSDFAGGFMFSENLGVDFELSSLSAPRDYTYTGTDASIGSQIGTTTIIQNAKSPILFTPSVVLQAGSDKLHIYSRLGLALPLSARINYDETDVFPATAGSIAETDIITVEYKTAFTVGFKGALGVDYKLGNQWSIYGEVSVLSMSLYVKELDVLSYLVNGQPLVGIPAMQFGTRGTNVNPNNGTGTQITRDIPFSNIGIHAGIRYSFTKSRPHTNRSKGKF